MGNVMTTDSLHIDRDSVLDLEIVVPSGQVRDLLSFIDRTRLPESRLLLERLLLAPLTSAQAILSRQRDLQVIAGMLPRLSLDAVKRGLNGTELYLARRPATLGRSLVTGLLMRAFNPKTYHETLTGLLRVRDLLDFVQGTLDILDQMFLEEEGDLHEIHQCFRAAMDDTLLSTIRRVRPGVGLVRLDHAVRSTKREMLNAVLSALRRLDALQALATLQNEPGFSYPEIVDSETPFVEARDVFHPLLKAPVPNDLLMGVGTRVRFITGPNMAGKSTHLRACGLLVLLAQMGAAVPGKRVRLGVFDRIFASITVRDSLQRGESFFLAEVRRLRELVNALGRGERVFALIDEAFKGTNVHDALEGTELIVRGLATCPRGVTLVASHLAELADGLQHAAPVDLYYFDAVLESGMLSFDYRLHPGVSHTRLGMHIIKREGLDSSLQAIADGGIADAEPGGGSARVRPV